MDPDIGFAAVRSGQTLKDEVYNLLMSEEQYGALVQDKKV